MLLLMVMAQELNHKTITYVYFILFHYHQVNLNNITIEGFGTAILNNGLLTSNKTDFRNNCVKYKLDYNDLGGAVRNYGVCRFNNTNFAHNYANRGWCYL